MDSLLTDTSIRRTPRVGPCLALLPLFDSLEEEISLRRTLTAGPKGVLLRGSWLYTDPQKLIVNKENKIIRCIVTHVDCRYFHGNQISKIIGGYGLYVLKKD